MQSSRTTIRVLTANDAGAFKALRLEAIAEAPSAVWPTRAEEAARSDAEVAARIEYNAYQVVYGAFIDNDLVGIAGLRREALQQVFHKATLWGVFVHPRCRQQGIARHLFDALRIHALDAGVLQIQLCVNAENEKAKSLYRSLGFVGYGVEPRAMRIGDRFYDEEHMCLQLDA